MPIFHCITLRLMITSQLFSTIYNLYVLSCTGHSNHLSVNFFGPKSLFLCEKQFFYAVLYCTGPHTRAAGQTRTLSCCQESSVKWMRSKTVQCQIKLTTSPLGTQLASPHPYQLSRGLPFRQVDVGCIENFIK